MISISGYVEVKFGKDKWEDYFNAGHILEIRNSDELMVALFGLPLYASYSHDIAFEPIATERGLPSHLSDVVKYFVNEGGGRFVNHPTWITLKEIENIDWSRKSEVFEYCLAQYRKNIDGSLTYNRCYFRIPQNASEVLGLPENDLISDHKFTGNEIYTVDDRVYKIEPLTLNSLRWGNDGWPLVVELMRRFVPLVNGELDDIRLILWVW